MYLLDTDIVSVLNSGNAPGSRPLLDWIDRNGPKLYLSVITLMELEGGALKVERRGASSRASQLRGFVGAVSTSFSGRVLPITSGIAIEAARLLEVALPAQIETSDLLIGATAKVHDLIVLTRNLRHFVPMGIGPIDLLRALPPDG